MQFFDILSNIHFHPCKEGIESEQSLLYDIISENEICVRVAFLVTFNVITHNVKRQQKYDIKPKTYYSAKQH